MNKAILWKTLTTGLSIFSLGLAMPAMANNGLALGHGKINHKTELFAPRIYMPEVSYGDKENNSSLTSASSSVRLIRHGDALIRDRLNWLNRTETKVTKSNLTDSQKASLKTMLDANISGLSALKAQIDSATSTPSSSVRALVNSIYTDFRIYAVVQPKVTLIMALDSQLNQITKWNTFFAEVQEKINAAKQAGKDVTAWQTALDTSKTNVNALTTTINADLTTLANVKPSDYPTSSTAVFKQVKADIRANNTVFVKARASIRASRVAK